MKLIEKIRKYTLKSIDANMKLEYKNALKSIEISARRGKYASKFSIVEYYENRDDIYFYIINRLKKEGFNVEVEKYGCQNSYKRLSIKWD